MNEPKDSDYILARIIIVSVIIIIDSKLKNSDLSIINQDFN